MSYVKAARSRELPDWQVSAAFSRRVARQQHREEGELTGVWVPDARHEAMRELTRARDAARQDLTRKRQQVSSMLLRLGRHYPGIRTWNARHRSWLANLRLEHREQRFALEEMLLAERQASDRIGRLEQAIREALADWSLAPIVPALMAMRGIDLVSAVTILGRDR